MLLRTGGGTPEQRLKTETMGMYVGYVASLSKVAVHLVKFLVTIVP